MKPFFASFLPLLPLLICIAFSRAQAQNPVLQKACTVEEISFGKIQEDSIASSLSPIDLIEMQPRRLYFRTSERYFADGHHTFQTTLLNAGEVFAQWPAVVGRMVSDSAGVHMYDTTNVLWHAAPADSAYSASYEETRQDVVAMLETLPLGFPVPDSAQLVALDSAGYTIQLLDNDAVRIANEEEEVLYEPQAMRVSTENYLDGRLERNHVIQYSTVPGYGVVPWLEREIRYETRPSGACLERITVRHYSAYDVALEERSSPARPNRDQSAVRLEIWPNPSTAALSVRLPGDLTPGSPVRILDTAGRPVLERSDAPGGAAINLLIGHLPPGLYYLQANVSSGTITKKFVKF